MSTTNHSLPAWQALLKRREQALKVPIKDHFKDPNRFQIWPTFLPKAKP